MQVEPEPLRGQVIVITSASLGIGPAAHMASKRGAPGAGGAQLARPAEISRLDVLASKLASRET